MIFNKTVSKVFLQKNSKFANFLIYLKYGKGMNDNKIQILDTWLK